MRSVPDSRCASPRSGATVAAPGHARGVWSRQLCASYNRRCRAPDIPARQMKVGIGGEGGACDLRCRCRLKRRLLLQKAGVAVSGRRVESQYCAEGAAMDQALAHVSARLETERLEVCSPGARHPFRSACSSSQQPTCGTLSRTRGPVTARTGHCKRWSPGETGSAVALAQGMPRQPVAALAPGAALQ